jgi:hypothetical protein
MVDPYLARTVICTNFRNVAIYISKGNYYYHELAWRRLNVKIKINKR